MTDQPAVDAARALVRHLVSLGVRDVVLSPGSRSAPLAYAVAAAAHGGLIDLHVRIDERTAAFLALGLSRGAAVDGLGTDPAPVVIITTSGTAVANLHPAVLEAHHRGVPLILLTADRPAEKRGTGANQTTEQVGIFAGAVRYAADVPAPDGRPGEIGDMLATVTRAVSAATGARTVHPGPVHLNLAFRPPLVPQVAPGPLAAVPADVDEGAQSVRVVPVQVATADVEIPDLGPALVVAGDGAGPLARRVAEERGWPLIAEPSSGAAGGPNLVPAAALALPAVATGAVDVVVFGRPTLTRPVQQLLASPEVRLIVVAPGAGPWPDEWHRAAFVLPAVPTAWLDPDHPAAATADQNAAFLDRWRRIGAAAAEQVSAAADGDVPTGLAVARCLLRASDSTDVLVVGSSSPIRDLDTVTGIDGGEPPTIVANRGVAGIDGTVSTAIGVALAAARSGRRTRALMGDLTFLHDVGGLLRGPAEATPNLRIVVVNDNGGAIFATLEPGALAGTETVFERVFATAHGADLGSLCAGYGVGHRRVSTITELVEALAEPEQGIEVIEVPVDRGHRRADGLALTAQVREAVADN